MQLHRVQNCCQETAGVGEDKGGEPCAVLVRLQKIKGGEGMKLLYKIDY